MFFANAGLFGLLVVPAGLAVAQLALRAPRLVLPIDHARDIPAGRSRALTALATVAALLPSAILAVAIILAAGPERLEAEEDMATVRNVVVCLDVSYSMKTLFAPGLKRFDAAIEAVKVFAKECRGTAFGLVVFGVTPVRWIPLTRDLDAIETAPPVLNPEKLPLQITKGTNITSGVDESRKLIQAQPNRDQLILLITDGEDNLSGLTRESAKRIAMELRTERTRLHVLHVGLPVIPAEMDVLARETGGLAQPALDPSTLEQVLQEIARLHQVETKATRTIVVSDRAPVAALGLLLIALYAASLLGLRYTPW
jgi:hypothetical protein